MLRRTNYRKIRKTDWANFDDESTIDSEGFKGGTRGAPIMPRDAVSRTANVERTGWHKWVNIRLNTIYHQSQPAKKIVKNLSR